MFTQISWSNYFIIILLLAAGYYLVIGYLYYRHDFLKIISGKKKVANDYVAAFPNQDSVIQSFSDEVCAYMNEVAKNKQQNKSNIIHSLKLLLRKYPSLSDLSIKESIQNIINNGCKTYCSIHLSAEELSELWD